LPVYSAGPSGSTKQDRGTSHPVNKGAGNDLAVLSFRLVLGGLLAGHGAQKLFERFNGPGREGTSGFMEMLGLKPGRPWVYLAGGSEFGGGVLTTLGLPHPVSPVSVIGSMATATTTAHGGKPIWVTEGGAELTVTSIAGDHTRWSRQVVARPCSGHPAAGLNRIPRASDSHTHLDLRRPRERYASGSGRSPRGAGGRRRVAVMQPPGSVPGAFDCEHVALGFTRRLLSLSASTFGPYPTVSRKGRLYRREPLLKC
jgi:putative oxidoreductase